VLGTLVAVIVAFLLLVSVISVAGKYFSIKAHNKDLQAEKIELQRKQENLKEMNDYLATPEGSEQALRDKFNVVKPGEGIIIVTPPDTTPPPVKKTGVMRWWDAVLRGLGIRKSV
jgi:cell division protein FtsB